MPRSGELEPAVLARRRGSGKEEHGQAETRHRGRVSSRLEGIHQQHGVGVQPAGQADPKIRQGKQKKENGCAAERASDSGGGRRAERRHGRSVHPRGLHQLPGGGELRTHDQPCRQRPEGTSEQADHVHRGPVRLRNHPTETRLFEGGAQPSVTGQQYGECQSGGVRRQEEGAQHPRQQPWPGSGAGPGGNRAIACAEERPEERRPQGNTEAAAQQTQGDFAARKPVPALVADPGHGQPDQRREDDEECGGEAQHEGCPAATPHLKNSSRRIASTVSYRSASEL